MKFSDITTSRMYACRSCGYPVIDDKVDGWQRSLPSCPVCGIRIVSLGNTKANWAKFLTWVPESTLVIVDEENCENKQSS